jgi:hypothetical protein
MAIWQYVTYLIPEEAVQLDGSVAGLKVVEEVIELPEAPFSCSLKDVEAALAGYLAPAESWSPNLRLWGDNQKDDIDVYFEGERVCEIRARLDLRDITRDRVVRLAALARRLKCCFLEGRTLEVVPATEEKLLASIAQSASAKFVRDPRGYLEGLGRDSATNAKQASQTRPDEQAG